MASIPISATQDSILSCSARSAEARICEPDLRRRVLFEIVDFNRRKGCSTSSELSAPKMQQIGIDKAKTNHGEAPGKYQHSNSSVGQPYKYTPYEMSILGVIRSRAGSGRNANQSMI